MSKSDARYYRRREAQELKASTIASDSGTGLLHREMAKRYADLAKQHERALTPAESSTAVSFPVDWLIPRKRSG
jgi:hypothetical protein